MCQLKAPFAGCKQQEIVDKKQVFDSAASNSDTLVESIVKVNPI